MPRIPAKFQKLAPAGVILVLGLAIIISFGFQIYQLWVEADKIARLEEIANREAQTAAAGTAVKKETIDELLAVQLFGKAAAPKAESKIEIATENLPKTNLRLTLRGVSANPAQEQGSAIIESSGKKIEYFAVGDSLPGNATLRGVYPDRVVLERSGRLENLYFPQETGIAGIQGSATNRTQPDEGKADIQQPGESRQQEPTYRTRELSEQRREALRQKLLEKQ